MERIILASQSPRRKQLLEWADLKFEIVIPETDESYPGGLSFEETAIHIARAKARQVASVYSSRPILAADTIVVWENEILGKPSDREDAICILSKLSGSGHKVITGVCILFQEKEISFADVTDVNFNSLTRSEIEDYVDRYKPFDKAGAYAIQEWIGVVGIKNISGDFYNVMGLPVNRVYKALKSLGVIS